MRVSIRKHNRSYLERLGSQMECSDYTEVINYLLTELRRVNYSFNAQVNLGINAHQIIEPESPTEPGQYAMSGLSAINDPLIERLVTAGLEEF